MRTFSEYIGDAVADAMERRAAPARDSIADSTYTQMELLDALPANVRVDKYGAMMSSDFMACETVKARAIRSLPVRVMRKGPNGPERAEDHPLNAVFARPNSLMSWGDLATWATIRRDCFGTVYMKAYRDMFRGTIREIRPVLAPVNVSFDRRSGRTVYSAPMDYFNEAWTCYDDDLVVLKTDMSEDGGRTGKSIAEKAADDIGLSIDLTRFYRSLLENGNHFKGYLETDNTLKVADINAIRESLKETSGVESAGAIRIFDRGLKYKGVSANLDGMDLVEQERFVLEKVCRACHVDPHHVYADGGSTATAASGADLDFAKNTVLPEVKAWEEAFQPLLDRTSSGGRPEGYYVKFNMAGLERADIKTRMEAHRIAVYAGIYTRAKAAELEDIPWMAGQDRLLQPTAYYVLDEDGVPYAPDARTLGTSGQSDGVSGRDEKAIANVLRTVADDARDRIARRAAADGDCPKTRAFAREVMRPIALAAELGGVEFDMEAEIEDEIGRSTWK